MPCSYVCFVFGIMDLLKTIFSVFIVTFIFISVSQSTKSLGSVKCNSDANCTINAFCHTTKVCYCKDGYSANREPDVPGSKAFHTVCLKEASGIGDFCTVDTQCKATFGTHSTCVHDVTDNQVGRCYCSENAHFRYGICYKTSLIGEMCDVNDNCLIKSKNIQAFCEYSRCTCPPNYHPTNDAADCQPSSVLGGPCIDDVGCRSLNSECRHGVCRCKQKYIVRDQNNCVLLAEKLEDPCEIHDQCNLNLPLTQCDGEQGVCVCKADSHNVNGSCWKSEKLLDPCTHIAECLINKRSSHGIVCKSGICQCNDGYSMEERSYCVKVNIAEHNAGGRSSPQIFITIGIFLLMIYIKNLYLLL